MDQSTEGQLRVIRKVIVVTQSADIPVWLFGGWGLDARIGKITREHGALTGCQTDRPFSSWGDGPIGCSHQDPSATSPERSMACWFRS
jgi:hypothetical protein